MELQVIISLHQCPTCHVKKRGVLGVTLAPVELDAKEAALYPDLTPGPYLKLCVKDTGHGMDAATMEQIFDPYFATKEKGMGTRQELKTSFNFFRDLQLSDQQGYPGSVSLV